mgnify:CR=1 FL=1
MTKRQKENLVISVLGAVMFLCWAGAITYMLMHRGF